MYTPHKPISKEALITCLQHQHCFGGKKVVEQVRGMTFRSITILDVERTDNNQYGIGAEVSDEEVEEFDSYCGDALAKALEVLGVRDQYIQFASYIRLHNGMKLL